MSVTSSMEELGTDHIESIFDGLKATLYEAGQCLYTYNDLTKNSISYTTILTDMAARHEE